MKGKFIVIEGTDCSGKETQTKLIEKKLKEQKIKNVLYIDNVKINDIIKILKNKKIRLF